MQYIASSEYIFCSSEYIKSTCSYLTHTIKQYNIVSSVLFTGGKNEPNKHTHTYTVK